MVRHFMEVYNIRQVESSCCKYKASLFMNSFNTCIATKEKFNQVLGVHIFSVHKAQPKVC